MTYHDYKRVYVDKSLSLKDWQENHAKNRNTKITSAPPSTYSFGHKSNKPTRTFGGVECTVSYSKEKFFDGRIERDCIVYTTKDGAKFFFPKDLNVDLQTMTPNMAISVWNELPKSLRDLSQKKIVFLDIYNPDDDYWAVTYEKFTRSYATGGREIIFWRYDEAHLLYKLKHTYCHEIGHFIDGGEGIYSSSSAWLAAMKSDEKTSGQKYVTSYGKNSLSEDFADSVAEYFVNRKVFANTFLERFKLLKEVFEYG